MPGTSACFPDRRHGPCRQWNKQDSRAGDAFAGAFFAQLPTLARACKAPEASMWIHRNNGLHPVQ